MSPKRRNVVVRDQESTTQKSADGEVAPTPNPETVVVGPESPRESRRGEGGGEATRSGSRNESEKGEIDPERLSSRVPEITTVGSESPHESQREECEGEGPRIDNAKEFGWRGPTTSNPETLVVVPKSPRVSQKEEGGGEKTYPGPKRAKGRMRLAWRPTVKPRRVQKTRSVETNLSK